MNEFAKERQWSVDVIPDSKGMAELKKLKLTPKMKKKDWSPSEFISFRQGEFKKSGEANDPITITDAQGNPWPQNVKIGNGSVADVKFSYTDFGTTKGNYIKAIRVLKHVPYVAQEFAPLSEDDEFFAADVADAEPQATASDTPSTAEAEDLDDDIPF